MLRKVNLKDAVNAAAEMSAYEKVGGLNDLDLNVFTMENKTSEYHAHAESDEMLYSIEGCFYLETEDRFIKIDEGEFIVVPRGTNHRLVTKDLAKFFMIRVNPAKPLVN
ncbi:MAG: cupin domain-containing protein [Fusobacteriaceae bacterium]|nr:cupin domain-containing protein [Fusobacteriaceae bacterium]